MKSLLHTPALLLAAVFCLPQIYAQDTKLVTPPPQPVAMGRYQNQQEGGGSMDDLQDHSVRGDVTAISGNSITVKNEEGEVYTVATGPNTRFRKQSDQIKISDVHVGDMIAAIGEKDPKAKTLGAVFVVVIDKTQYAQARADFGKTWTAGVVQSINGTNILIKRPDNITQTVAVDENTSFRERRQDITLPDIKVGDNVTARGALQKGAFLATVVSVGRRGGIGGGGNGYRPHPATNSTAPQPGSQPNQ
ncbi:MAG: DUF5666 domain-containing protein [Silvibacterium sp.]